MYFQFKLWSSASNFSFTYEIKIVSDTSDGTQFPETKRSLKCTMERIYLPVKCKITISIFPKF